jgi:hypothetical protein
MAARCSIVASSLDGHRSAAGGHAQLFPVGDGGALTRALRAALVNVRSNGVWNTLALDRAFAYANELSMTNLARRYQDIYENIL